MLDVNGLQVKRFAQIVQDAQQRLDDSGTGIVITDKANETANNIGNVFALALAEAYEFMENVYFSFDIYSAEGEALDNLVAFKKLYRISDKPSSGFVSFQGNGSGTVNTSVRLSDNRGRQVQVTSARVLGSGSFYKLNIILPDNPVDGTVYSYSVGNVIYSYTATGVDTKATLAAALTSTSDLHTVTVTAENDLLIESRSVSNISCNVISNLTQGSWEGLVPCAAIETGSLSFPVNTINNLDSTLSFITGVYNPVDFNLGNAEETDTELRQRFLDTTSASAYATVPSIDKAVSDVTGVTSVNVINNPTSNTVDGIPPHSYETVVLGGEDQDIAEAIFNVGAAGIQAFGNVITNVTDSKGSLHSIGFSRPTNVYIFVNVDYELDGVEPFPANGEDLIRDQILSYADTLSGNILIPSKFNIPVYNVAGIGEVVVTLGSSSNPADVTPTGGFSVDRLVLGVRDSSVFERERITTNEVAIG